jgi:hypothetical protein
MRAAAERRVPTYGLAPMSTQIPAAGLREALTA